MYESSSVKHSNVTNEIPGWGKGLRKVGDAVWLPEEYSVIKLNLFPGTKYYLRPHRVRLYEYVLYSCCENGELSQPVGRGEVIGGTGYIQVQFFDIKMSFFLQFFQTVKLELVAA